MNNARALFEDLRRAGQVENNTWRVRQTNHLDQRTRFIYRCGSAQDLEDAAATAQLSPQERMYAVHRWRNFNRHEAWLQLLRERIPDFVSSQNRFNKTMDFSLVVRGDRIPFDLKVTRYPQSVQDGLSDSALAEWLYRNQSTQQRFHLANRLFVIGEPEAALYDFELACATVDAFATDFDAHCHILQFDGERSAVSIILRQLASEAA